MVMNTFTDNHSTLLNFEEDSRSEILEKGSENFYPEGTGAALSCSFTLKGKMYIAGGSPLKNPYQLSTVRKIFTFRSFDLLQILFSKRSLYKV